MNQKLKNAKIDPFGLTQFCVDFVSQNSVLGFLLELRDSCCVFSLLLCNFLVEFKTRLPTCWIT